MNPDWAGAAQWRVLNVGVSSSAHFLRTWQSWRADAQRPRMLHYVAMCGDAFQNTADDADLTPLADELDAQLWGLLPGFHRLVFDGGQVLLTLCIGDVQTLLKQQQFVADAVLLNHLAYAATGTLYAVKAIARLCRRGTVLMASPSDSALQAAFKQCGFDVSAARTTDASEATEPTEATEASHAVYNPAWTPKTPMPTVVASTCVVIGAGLAGAAVASSLARRNWAVTVLDAASQPASGASSLPAGLLVPHTSPDDSWLSRLSRSGVRITLQQARAHLRHGTDWAHTGVLQRFLQEDFPKLPRAWAGDQSLQASDWCYKASAKTLAAAGLPPGGAALWHRQAGWVKPAAMVAAWLATPGVTWRGNSQVAQISQVSKVSKVSQVESSAGRWRVLNAAGDLLAQANVLVLAAGYPSRALAATLDQAPDLQAIRGQVTLGLQNDSTPSQPSLPSLPLPPFPINGHGGLITHITTPDGPKWLMGASYERDVALPALKPQDHTDNLTRLQTLLPDAADALASQFAEHTAQGWAGIRCATPNRLPLVMPLTSSQPSLSPSSAAGQAWLCTGMGSRGLSFAALCGELLAAQLHAEPLPVELQLASALARHARQPQPEA